MAEEELKKVDRLIFCGYSLPPSDIQFKYLLKRTQVNREEHQPPIEIFIFNKKHEHSLDEWNKRSKWTREQYERFFGVENVEYLPGSFEDLATRGLDIDYFRNLLDNIK